MTSLSAARPWCLLLLASAPAFVMAWRRWPPPIPPGRSRAALALRLVLLILVVLALADVRFGRAPERRALVAVVDLSDSTLAATTEAAIAVLTLQEAKSADDLFGVVTFGRNALVEMPPSSRPAFGAFQTRPDGGYSDLAGALGLAANLIPDGYSRQVVLVSDGRQNLGDAARMVERLRDRSVRVDVAPLGTAPRDESVVVALEAPAEVREGEALTVTARLRATGSSQGRLMFLLDGRETESRVVALAPGASTQTLSLPPLEPGEHRLRAVLDAQPDTYPQNNVADSVIRVRGAPKVLVLEGAPGEAANVRSGLQAAGMVVETRPVGEAPTAVAGLTGYDATVVVDAPAPDFPPGAMDALSTASRDLGRGLVSIGGPRSYGPGGWQGTPLEEALPVRMEVPRSKERPAVAVVLVMETMESEEGDGVVLGSVDAVIDQLTPEDELAMVRMGTPGGRGLSTLVLQLAPMNEAQKVVAREAVRTAVLGDPLGYAQSIEVALDALASSAAATKHVIIAGDGDALADVGSYPTLLGRARAEGVVVTSIGVDTHVSITNMDHMEHIAELGGGRFFLSNTAADVPEILLESTRRSLRPWFEQDPFFPRVTSAGELLQGVALEAFPQLGGYVVTTPKPTAEVALSSPRGDPVLAGGRHGLGRTVAWTSDADGRWTAGLLASPVAGTLFGRLVAWSLPVGGPEPLRIEAMPQGAGLDVTVSGPEQGGSVAVEAFGSGHRATTTNLRPVGPGRWQGQVPVDETGTYVLSAVLERAGSLVGQSDLSVPVPYSPEYIDQGRDDGLLGALASRSGTVVGRPAAAWALRPLPLTVTRPVFWLLVLIVAVLWPADVAVRRLTASPASILASVGTVLAARVDAWHQARERAALAKGAAAGRLRQTIEASRSADAAEDPAGPGSQSAAHAPSIQPPVGDHRAHEHPVPSEPAGQPATPDPNSSVDIPAHVLPDLSSRLVEAKRKRDKEERR